MTEDRGTNHKTRVRERKRTKENYFRKLLFFLFLKVKIIHKNTITFLIVQIRISIRKRTLGGYMNVDPSSHQKRF